MEQQQLSSDLLRSFGAGGIRVDAPAIRIVVSHGGANVETDDCRVHELVGRSLTVPEWRFGVNSNGTYRQQADLIFYTSCKTKKNLRIAAGLAQRTTALLRYYGYEVRVEDRRRFDDIIQPVPSAPPLANDADLPFLQCVGRAPGGFIEIADETDSIHKTILLCRLYRNARTLVVLPDRVTEKAFWKKLVRAFGCALYNPFSWTTRFPTRGRLVCCVRHIRNIVSHEREFDVVVLPGGLRGLGIDLQTALHGDAFAGAKRFGMIGAQQPLSYREAVYLESTVGPRIWPVSGSDATAARLLVLRLAGERPTPREYDSHLDWKRAALWHNEARNRLLAECAQAVTAPAAAGLLNEPSQRTSALEALLASPRSRRVAILVESTEHGRELLNKLPGWELCSLPSSQGWGGVQRHSVAALDKQIVTHAYARAVAGIDADVIIRADGGDDILDIVRLMPRETLGGRTVLLISVDDGSERSVLLDAANLATARNHGWEIVEALQPSHPTTSRPRA